MLVVVVMLEQVVVRHICCKFALYHQHRSSMPMLVFCCCCVFFFICCVFVYELSAGVGVDVACVVESGVGDAVGGFAGGSVVIGCHVAVDGVGDRGNCGVCACVVCGVGVGVYGGVTGIDGRWCWLCM